MTDALHSQRLTHLLEHSSAKLDELLRQLQLHDQQLMPLELLDEIAVTTGELMLVLLDYQSSHKSEELVQEVISHAQCLRHALRSQQLQTNDLTADVSSFNEDVGLIIRDSKLAA
jgi:23S rRNA C2498 (ribose-2'-O)-methylase RlmM